MRSTVLHQWNRLEADVSFFLSLLNLAKTSQICHSSTLQVSQAAQPQQQPAVLPAAVAAALSPPAAAAAASASEDSDADEAALSIDSGAEDSDEDLAGGSDEEAAPDLAGSSPEVSCRMASQPCVTITCFSACWSSSTDWEGGELSGLVLSALSNLSHLRYRRPMQRRPSQSRYRRGTPWQQRRRQPSRRRRRTPHPRVHLQRHRRRAMPPSRRRPRRAAPLVCRRMMTQRCAPPCSRAWCSSSGERGPAQFPGTLQWTAPLPCRGDCVASFWFAHFTGLPASPASISMWMRARVVRVRSPRQLGTRKHVSPAHRREVPREPLLLVIRSFGGAAAWAGEGSPLDEADDSITHQVPPNNAFYYLYIVHK